MIINWNLSNIGNFWDDFETNPGYPSYYVIDGEMNRIDWHPISDMQVSDGDEIPIETAAPSATTVHPISPVQTSPPPPITIIPPSTQPPIVDSDGDGWTDSQEINSGTDPEDKDTDDDGFWDPNDPNPLDPNVPEKLKESIEKQTGFMERISNLLEKIFNIIFGRDDV
jgi:hypothetical protein